MMKTRLQSVTSVEFEKQSHKHQQLAMKCYICPQEQKSSGGVSF